jgi:hypothetical protein
MLGVRWLASILGLAFVAAGCVRHAEVVSDPGALAAAVLVVGNQTDWEVLIELVPEDGATGALTLGHAPPNEATAFENVPARQAFTLRATVIGTARMLTGPTRVFEPRETWEWLIRPGTEWQTP